MYVTMAQIENIRSIRSLEWEIKPAEAPGWHVILGENGSGKSTLLRSIALALVGERDAGKLRQDWSRWLTYGEKNGMVCLNVIPDPAYDEGEDARESKRIEFATTFERDDDFVELSGNRDGGRLPPKGWFSAGYGPFRRFGGMGVQQQELMQSRSGRLSAHLSIFGEDYSLTEALEWLKQLNYQRLEKRQEGHLLDSLMRFVNQPDFLPQETQLTDVSSEGVTFRDANGALVPVESLSDGYRSILSMTFELIRQLSLVYSAADIFSKDRSQILAPGVVLIDEVDAHLHPTWQREIGFRLCEHFPNIQFIIATHSPLVCQAAIKGSIWKLPRPGSEQVFHRVEEPELSRLLYGNVLDALGTGLFGSDVARSEPAKEKLQRLAELNMKELQGSLTAKETSEQQALRAVMPTAASTSRERK
ncbi:MAG: AAA family ATPase [Anaerolineae bacterium]|nr:AAA family ATPase [Anaerolineae bacterium]